MKSTKLVGVKMRTEKRGDQTIEVLETKIVDNKIPCKECKKNIRRQGSAYCVECTAKYKSQMLTDRRLQKKVEEASQIKKLIV